MGDLTANFSRSEFACKCGCGLDDIDMVLVYELQDMRDFFEKRITVTSGCRCTAYNKKVGGRPRSQHLLGKAADIVVQDIEPALVQEYAEQVDFPGIGRYDDFTHVDVRDGRRARWGTPRGKP